MPGEPILLVAAPKRGRALVERWRGRSPAFVCVLAHTDTCLIPGISAAGVSESLRALTPAADAEVVAYGAPRCLPALPSNPLGAPGPAGITRAAVTLAEIPARFVGVGLTHWPDVPHTVLSWRPGGRIDRGGAVPDARDLFSRGAELGASLASMAEYVVLGESVPGGTTTALALLLALGIDAEGRVSGSTADNAHSLKTALARAALRVAGLAPGDARGDPLGAVATLGDPMQPVAAGMCRGLAAAGVEVLLAGGSQMIAVAALLAALETPAALRNVAIGTTRWVATDPHADVPGLAGEVSPDLAVLAANLDFSHSRHVGLKAYEGFLVKEGVGAGGACIAALTSGGRTLPALHAAIDAAYDPAPATAAPTL